MNTIPAALEGEGPTIGFSTQEAEERRSVGLEVEGSLPEWLVGTLLRTGPAKFEIGGRRVRHWFDGLAMLHSFSLSGGEVRYASRFLQSRAYRAARERGEIAYSEFATDPCRRFFSRVQALFSPEAFTDNGNVNVAALGERMLAMSETPMPVEFDRSTLATQGHPYSAPGHFSTAHPHYDRYTGALINYAVRLGPLSSYRFFSLEPGSEGPETIASWPVARPAYMHSFALTENYLVLAEFPFTVNPTAMLLRGRPYIENFRWAPERGTRFHVVERRGGRVRGGFRAPARFAFHHVNAFEEADRIVCDVAAFEDPSAIEWLYLERLRETPSVPRATMTRFSLNLSAETVAMEELSEANIELPQINYERCNGSPYRYAWGVGVGDSGFFDHIVKVDASSGEASYWEAPGAYPGEPVFVAAPGKGGEDQGVLLSLLLEPAERRSALAVIDAASMRELARAPAPSLIPFGFHGRFV
jgi:beta,beta-carotene 9',10'-dioxygenase